MIDYKNYETTFILLAIWRLAKGFKKKIWFWIKNGMKLVPYYVCWKRRIICYHCVKNKSMRCPHCGCFIHAITKLATSRCENWDLFMDKIPDEILAASIEPTDK